MSDTMALYTKILWFAMKYNAVTRDILLMLHPSKHYVEAQISLAIQKKHIKAKKFTNNKNDKRRTTHYYTITSEGIKHLKKKAKDIEPWLAELSNEDIDSLTVIGAGVPLSDTRLVRYANISTSAMFADLAGAEAQSIYMLNAQEKKSAPSEDTRQEDISPVTQRAMNAVMGDPFDDFDEFYNEEDFDCDIDIEPIEYCAQPEDKGAKHISQVVREAKNRYNTKNKKGKKGMGQNVIDQASPIRYTNSQELKASVYKAGNKDKAALDIKRCALCGILESQFLSASFYCAVYENRFMWSRHIAQKDVSLLGKTMKNKDSILCSEVNKKERHCILLVRDAQQFEDIFTQRRKEANTLGIYYDYMTILPLSLVGVEHLKMIAGITPKDMLDELIDLSVSSGKLARNSNDMDGAFELVSNDGVPYAICYNIDVIKIQHMIAAISKAHIKKIGIICCEWQREYLKTIFPTAEYKILLQ